MEHDALAIDGLLRELARAPEGDDESFVARVLARTQPRRSIRPALVLAASLLGGIGIVFALAPQAPAGRLGPDAPACLFDGAVRTRVLLGSPGSDRLRVLGEIPRGSSAGVPAGTPILLQAVGADGMALWTSPRWTRLSAAPRGPAPSLRLEASRARSVQYARDVEPLLQRRCAGCHAEEELVAAARPFQARHSALVTRDHGYFSDIERRELALWVDLGASRP